MEVFHKKLDRVKQKTIEMAKYARNMLEDSVNALKNINITLAKDVHDRRIKLRQMDDEIEKLALNIIALHQPVAKDVRMMGGILKIITHLNRIGRYGKDIAKLTYDFENQEHFKKLVSIPQMVNIVLKMIDDVIYSFENYDISRIEIHDLEERDDVVDELRFSIFRECITYMMENPKLITLGSHYVMIARYLERCGDHACRIAEKIHYMVNAEIVEIR